MENLPDWVAQTLLTLIISAGVFVAGLWATQGTLVERIDNLSVEVRSMRADFNEMRRDLYEPRKP